MKKTALILTALLVFSCGEKEQETQNIWTTCIDGVVYLLTEHGITPKVNADFYPYTCNGKTKNRDIPN